MTPVTTPAPDPQPLLVTVPNVEIVSTGTYNLASGLTTFTMDDLAAAVGAVNDPSIQTPRIKLGHVDPRFDGEPTLGKVENMSLSEDGQTIYADFVGVPKWLADIMPTSYPARSIEGSWNVQSSTGNTHQLVITAVSLLGIMFPGVSTLEDLPILFSEEGPDDVEIVSAGVCKVVAKIGGTDMPVTAAVEVEDVRRQYYEGLEAEQTWWWIRSIRLDPNELIVDDDEGSLYRVPFGISGDKVTFEDPTEVKIEFKDVPKSKQKAAAMASIQGREVAVYASRAESRPESKEKGEQVSLAKKLAAKLGLTESATEEEVLARVGELQAGDGEPGEGEGQPPATPPADPATPAPATPATPEPGSDDDDEEEEDGDKPANASVQVPEGMTLVDNATLETLRAGAQAGSEARAEQLTSKRDRILDDAVKAGKFPPARKDHWAKQMKLDPEGAEQAIASMPADLIPVTERGSSPAEGETSVEAYPDSWLPEVAARKAETEAASNGRVTTEAV